MSFLTWAFALGGLAVAFPILFHLIRPSPKGSQPFGSLMFLRESPPRITKRSRIDNWLLLLLRGVILLLIAAAFMRPFFRTGGDALVADLPGKRVAILIDTSASMRRDGLWNQARTSLEEVLKDLDPADNVALFGFDRQIDTRVGFSGDRDVGLENRKNLIRASFAEMQPTWHVTDLGSSLASAADFVGEVDQEKRSETGLQIVLISDMQQGSLLSSLQSYVWPKDVRVDIRPVALDNPVGNASARVLPKDTKSAIELGHRVRLTNSADSSQEIFQVVWQTATGQIDEESRTEFYVAPGTSKLLRVPASSNVNTDRLIVEGDSTGFDDRFFVPRQSKQQISIGYFGDDKPDDAQGNLYFLSRVIPQSKSRSVTVDPYPLDRQVPWDSEQAPQMVVVTSEVNQAVARHLTEYVKDGGLVLATVTSKEILDSLQDLLGPVSSRTGKSRPDDYALLGSIDFSHPIFRRLSGPRFNDFTGIRFWNYFRLELLKDQNIDDTAFEVASFDDDSLAIWQNQIGDGTVIGMASSWRPQDSGWALSKKFVPMMTSVLRMTERSSEVTDSCLVGQNISLPVSSMDWQVTRPDQNTVTLPPATGTGELFDMPGVFQFSNEKQEFQIAVNLDPAESLTLPVDATELESLDVRVGTHPTQQELAGTMRKLKDKQLENRQRLWKWLLLAAVCLLVVETLVAGKQPVQTQPVEAAA